MVKKSYKEIVAFDEMNRLINYKESLRLEGIESSVQLHGKTKAEIISYYMNKL